MRVLYCISNFEAEIISELHVSGLGMCVICMTVLARKTREIYGIFGCIPLFACDLIFKFN